jgi:4-aminobutyrate aminotransferase-like enzyme
VVAPLPAVFHLAPFPDPTRFAGSAQECAARSLEALRQTVRNAPHGRPAAIIVEPIQGTAGNIVPPPGFLREVQRIAREAGALLIADEMITGFGRTGRWFACDHEQVVPDIMTLGKGMGSGFPVSAVLSTSEIVSAEPFSLPSASSSSYGGNPLAAAAALVTIETIRDERLVENAARRGDMLLEGLRIIASRRKHIANVRGAGLLVGFDLVAVDRRAPAEERAAPIGIDFLPRDACVRFFRDCLADGLILMGYTSRVRIHPPLVLSADEARRALEIIDGALGRLESAC